MRKPEWQTCSLKKAIIRMWGAAEVEIRPLLWFSLSLLNIVNASPVHAVHIAEVLREVWTVSGSYRIYFFYEKDWISQYRKATAKENRENHGGRMLPMGKNNWLDMSMLQCMTPTQNQKCASTLSHWEVHQVQQNWNRIIGQLGVSLTVTSCVEAQRNCYQ